MIQSIYPFWKGGVRGAGVGRMKGDGDGWWVYGCVWRGLVWWRVCVYVCGVWDV